MLNVWGATGSSIMVFRILQKAHTMFQPPFVTYSQNGEDALLWRALKGVMRGFYVDVGAQDPVKDSVTKAFYERGWRGINIEPVQYWHRRLAEDRPHDINLRLAASNSPGTMQLFEVQDSGLSTSDHLIAHQHEVSGYKVREHVVECTTLDQIFADHHVETVHFLKIDCEGAEKAVLEGISLTGVRPWIILVEATKPNSTEPTWQQWETLLTGRSYEFEFFDGLNRYYLAKEHMDLASAFATPVNIFDSVHLASEIEAQEHIERLRIEIEGLKGATTNAELRKELEATAAERNAAAALRDKAMAARDEAMATCGGALADRDEAIARCGRALAERDEAMARCGRALVDRDEAIAARDEAATERNDAYAARNKLAIQRMESLAVLAQVVVERDAAESVREKVTVQRDDLVARLSQIQDEMDAFRMAFETLHANQLAFLSSRSWRITAPLRACSTIARSLYRGVRRTLYLLIRRLAHAARPGLRWLAQNRVIRTIATTTLGKNSRLTEHARLFLFGVVTSDRPTSAMRGCEDDTAEVPGDTKADSSLNESVSTSGSEEASATFNLDLVMERIRREVVGRGANHEETSFGPENEGQDGPEPRRVFLPDFGSNSDHEGARINSEDAFATVVERIRAEVARREPRNKATHAMIDKSSP